MQQLVIQNNIRVVKGVPSGDISPVAYDFTFNKNILCPMRDGTNLALDLVLPNGTGPFPVILERTPYDKTNSYNIGIEDYARRGYAVVLQDVRGRFNSDGGFNPFCQEHNDGHDTVEWIADQEWCNGNVGMIGGSYTGQTQWFAASQAPKALKAIVPVESPPGNQFLNEPMYGGVMSLGIIEWMVLLGRRSFQMDKFKDIHSIHCDYFEEHSVEKVAAGAGANVQWWKEDWLNHPTLDEFWLSCGYEQFWPQMTVPALNISGWWGLNFNGAPRNFVGMREQAATAQGRDGQRLVMGPWPHAVNGSRILSGLDLGPDAVTGLRNYCLKFFDYYLKDKTDNTLGDDPRVHVFVVGANQWWQADTWPLPGTVTTPLYLHSEGQANSHRGDGLVSFHKPSNEPADSYISNPLDPVRLIWNMHGGPVDDRTVTERPDVLCYTSEALIEAIDVVGDISAVLYASSSAKDCDWHVRLVDVHPDGSARFMCHGALRARFNQGFDKTVLLNPDEITRFDIDMTATGIRFLPGHKIRIEVTSSWFNRFDRNLQTGAENWMRDKGEPVVATQAIYHDENNPSHILLPIIPEGSVRSADNE
jgi:putative CocE/NonD family hydrolase